MDWIKKLEFKNGLMPAIAQDCKTGEVLMLAYMNKESLMKTIKTGKCHYYSRSRGKLWIKGEISGHIQKVREVFVDCDMDCLLLKIEQKGAACHTGYKSCFYRKVSRRFFTSSLRPSLSHKLSKQDKPAQRLGTFRGTASLSKNQRASCQSRAGTLRRLATDGKLRVIGKKVFDPKKVYKSKK